MTDKLLIDRATIEQAREPSATDGRVVIEQRGGRLYMNNAEIGPGTIDVRLDGVTYRAAERVAVRPEPVRSQQMADAGFTRRPSLWSLQAREALELISAPQRPDGTWNRDREACRQLAAEALGRYDDERS